LLLLNQKRSVADTFIGIGEQVGAKSELRELVVRYVCPFVHN